MIEVEASCQHTSHFSVLLVSTLYEISSYGTRALTSLLQSKNINTDLLFTRSSSRFDNVLRNKTYRILSKNFEFEFLSFIKPYQIIGFTVYTDNLPECVQLSELIKKNYPEKQVIYGGIHATVAPEECLKFADYVCVGEGFISLPSFILAQKTLFENKFFGNRQVNIDLPNGIWKKNDKGETIKNGCGSVLLGLDSLPYPSYDAQHIFIRNNRNKIVHLDKEEYEQYFGCSYLTMMSIGCPNICSYCCNNALKKLHKDYASLRWHSPKYMINEILEAKKHYEFYNVWLMDDAFIAMPNDAFEQFLYEYRNKIGLPFVAQGIIPSIAIKYKDRIKKLVESGMVRSKIGVQTGSKKMLEIYKRKQNNEDVIALSKIFAKYKNRGVRASYDIILDGIYEEPKDIMDTIKLINSLHRPFFLMLFSLRCYPGTDLSETTGISYNRDDSFFNYRSTLGNFIIGSMNFITIPSFVIRWLERNENLLLIKVPSFIMKPINLLILLKRTFSFTLTRAYRTLPQWAVKLIKLEVRIRKGLIKRPGMLLFLLH